MSTESVNLTGRDSIRDFATTFLQFSSKLDRNGDAFQISASVPQSGNAGTRLIVPAEVDKIDPSI